MGDADVAVLHGAGDRTTYGYDLAGNTTAVTNPTANAKQNGTTAGAPITTTAYTPDNLVASITRVVTFASTDAKGNTQQATRRVTTYAYDNASRKQTANIALLTDTAPTGSGSTSGTSTAPVTTTTDGGTRRFAYYPDDRLAEQTGRQATGTTTAAGTIRTNYNSDGDTTSTADDTYANTMIIEPAGPPPPATPATPAPPAPPAPPAHPSSAPTSSTTACAASEQRQPPPPTTPPCCSLL